MLPWRKRESGIIIPHLGAPRRLKRGSIEVPHSFVPHHAAVKDLKGEVPRGIQTVKQ